MHQPVEVSREALLKVANLVKPALAMQAYIPSLTHICFDGVSAIAYNDISAILVRSPIDLEACIPGDLLIKSLNSLSAEKVLIQEDADGKVLLSSGRSKLKVPTLPITDFPFEAPPSSDAPIKITAEILKGIEMCLVAVGNDPTHPAQMGVTMEAGKKGATLFATDNFTVSRFQTKSKISLPADVPVILPKFFCEQLVALAKSFSGEPVELDVHAGSLVASFGEAAQLFTKQLVDLEPMEFDTILQKYKVDALVGEVAVTIPDDFDAAFNRALLVLGNEPDKITKVTLAGGKMKLLSTSSAGEASDTFTYDDPDGPAEPFFVDPVLVARASKACSKVAALDQVLVLGNNDLTFVHMIAHCTA